MADYRRIYDERAAAYHALVMAEDWRAEVDAWLGAALAGVGPASRVLDVGAGTGRVAAIVRRCRPDLALVCCDEAPAMLAELRASWPNNLGPTPDTVTADNGALPFPDALFGAATAGWTLGHLTGFLPDTWREHANRALDELERVVCPAGPIAILETLGTGASSPAPPRESLGRLYELFEARGYGRSVLRTDYRFAARAEAESLVGMFFGERMCERLTDDATGGGRVELIEWTGAWLRGSA